MCKVTSNVALENHTHVFFCNFITQIIAGFAVQLTKIITEKEGKILQFSKLVLAEIYKFWFVRRHVITGGYIVKGI